MLLIIFMVTAKLIVSKSVPLDLPKAASGSDIQTVFSIVLAADGTTQVDCKTRPERRRDPRAGAKAAHEKNPELRAVIKADSAVPHGRVIHVLDLLKQAQVAKIAFGVSPVAPGVPGARAPVPLRSRQTASQQSSADASQQSCNGIATRADDAAAARASRRGRRVDPLGGVLDARAAHPRRVMVAAAVLAVSVHARAAVGARAAPRRSMRSLRGRTTCAARSRTASRRRTRSTS